MRKQDAALEEQWAQREAERRQSLARVQTEYSRLESRLRKALMEVEVSSSAALLLGRHTTSSSSGMNSVTAVASCLPYES
jgi:hypothetical protein